MKLNISENFKGILIVLGFCIAFYIVIFTLWNTTSSEDKRPSSFFWDSHKDGYQEDPLYDRKK